MQNLFNQINDVLGEMRHLILRSSDVVSGPFSRTRAYSLAKPQSFVTVFKLHDAIDEYYLIDTFDRYGQQVHADLWSKRLILNRLRKELKKHETL